MDAVLFLAGLFAFLTGTALLAALALGPAARALALARRSFPLLTRILQPAGGSSEGERTWRLAFPRDAAFPPARSDAFLSALAPSLARGGQRRLWLELRSEGGRWDLRLTGSTLLTDALRGQLEAWAPGARLEECTEEFGEEDRREEDPGGPWPPSL